MDIIKRKKDHVELTANGQMRYMKNSGFNNYDFIHNAIPEMDYDQIDLRAILLNRTFSIPLFISSMTGGYYESEHINSIIAEVCESWDIPFGVGSQRAMLEMPHLLKTFSVVRAKAPKAFIASNIGAAQVRNKTSQTYIQKLIDSIQSDALIVHLNVLQEMMQAEGDRNFSGILNGIEYLTKHSGVPLIVKETGAGISSENVIRLNNVGVRVVDIAGAGGTSWAKVENQRSTSPELLFDEWGIPTVTILEMLQKNSRAGIEIIASGGVLNGADIVKSLCLGANFTAMAQPVISAIKNGGAKGFDELLEKLKKQINIIYLLLGCKDISALGMHYLYKTH